MFSLFVSFLTLLGTRVEINASVDTVSLKADEAMLVNLCGMKLNIKQLAESYTAVGDVSCFLNMGHSSCPYPLMRYAHTVTANEMSATGRNIAVNGSTSLELLIPDSTRYTNICLYITGVLHKGL